MKIPNSKERMNDLVKQQRCFQCLRDGHNAPQYIVNKNCFVCNESHNAAIFCKHRKRDFVTNFDFGSQSSEMEESQKLATITGDIESEEELSKAKIKNECAEPQEKVRTQEDIAILFEEFEDEKARLSNENTKLQKNKVKVLKELDQIHQSKLNTHKSKIMASQAKM
jgi:hypothetical protein